MVTSLLWPGMALGSPLVRDFGRLGRTGHASYGMTSNVPSSLEWGYGCLGKTTEVRCLSHPTTPTQLITDMEFGSFGSGEECPGAAITEDHKVGGLKKIYPLKVWEARSPKSVSAGPHSLRRC